MLSSEQIEELERIADANAGHCDRCGQTIKIYRYKINRVHALFMRAMAKAVRESGINNVDIGTIGLPYSVRSQNSKLRQHGLIARVKNERGAQIPRHWLITSPKGRDFLNGKAIQEKVVVFNNQVLGHEGSMVTIHEVLGELPDPEQPQFEDEPVGQAEARTLENVRKPTKYMTVPAQFKRRDYQGRFKIGQTYAVQIKRLQVGKPVEVVGIDANPKQILYKDIAAFRRDWKIL